MNAEPRYALEPSHHIKSKVPPDTTFDRVRNFTTGTVIECYRRPDSMFVAICTNHGIASPAKVNRVDSYRASRFPQGWCVGCQKLLGITRPAFLPKPETNGHTCEFCKVYSHKVVAFGHLDDAGRIYACPECRKGDAFKQQYGKRFGPRVEQRKSEWKGMSAKERKQALKRLALVGRNEGYRQ